MVALPPLVRGWLRRDKLAARFRTWFLLSYGVGFYATIPGVLRWMGAPDAFCDGWWMNVFLFYPLINILKPGAMTSGPLALGACFAVQYALLLMAVKSYSRGRRASSAEPG